MKFFSVKLFAKIDRYVTYVCHVVLEAGNFEDKIKAHFLKKLAFALNKCLAKDTLEKCPRTTKNLSKYTIVCA